MLHAITILKLLDKLGKLALCHHFCSIFLLLYDCEIFHHTKIGCAGFTSLLYWDSFFSQLFSYLHHATTFLRRVTTVTSVPSRLNFSDTKWNGSSQDLQALHLLVEFWFVRMITGLLSRIEDLKSLSSAGLRVFAYDFLFTNNFWQIAGKYRCYKEAAGPKLARVYLGTLFLQKNTRNQNPSYMKEDQ